MNQQDLWAMKQAIAMAEIAYREDEVPVGAVIIGPQGEILAQSSNQKENYHNPTGHAEMLAIQEAAKKLKSWRLTGCSIYVTLEPCTMCLSAIQQSRIATLYFGAYDKKGGAISLGHNLHNDLRLNHQFSVIGGIYHFECSKLLSDFFKQKRRAHKNK